MSAAKTGAVVDSKVVEMSFENSQFESNAEKSISTLDKLKQALKFTDSTEGLDNINSSLKGIKLDPLKEGVYSLRGAFDSLAQTAGFTAIMRYTNQALDAVENLVGSVTVGAADMAAGWQKYGDKTTSVATLVAQGYDIEQVTDQLERLNWFTDETSYNFIDMVSSISKFTASGQGLEESVTAMEGIANWAALSGQNAAKASSAMYQLSQAMGSGIMRKEDYKSIQNVSMDTDEFRQHALDAAVALGTLKKNADDTYESLVADGKKGAEAFTKSQFAESLTQGQWFTKDVMMKVFNEYSAAVDQIYEYSEEKGITASEAIQEAGDQFDEFGMKAFKAAQQARTWDDVVDSLKDASSTAFMNMFEIIFGNAEEATELFTNMANSLYDVFVEPINQVNELLDEAFGVPEVDKVIDESGWNNLGLTVGNAEALAKALRKVGEEEGVAFKDDSMESFTDSLESGWLTADKLKETLEQFGSSGEGLTTTAEDVAKIREAALAVIKGDYGNNMEERLAKLKEAGFEDPQVVQDYVNKVHELAGGTWNITDAILAEADASVGLTESLANMSDEQLKAAGYTDSEIKRLRKLAEVSKETGKPLNELLSDENNDAISGKERLFNALGQTIGSVGRIADIVKAAFETIFPPATADTITNIIAAIEGMSKAFTAFTRKNQWKIRNIFLGIFSAIDIVVRVIKTFITQGLNALKKAFGGSGDVLMKFLSNIGRLIFNLRNFIVENQLIEKVVGKVIGVISKAVGTVKGWIEAFLNLPGVSNVIKAFGRAFGITFDDVPETLKGAETSVTNFRSRTETAFKIFKKNKDAKQFFKGIKGAFAGLAEDIKNFKGFKAFAGAVNIAKEAFLNWIRSLSVNADGTLTPFGEFIENLIERFAFFKFQIKATKDRVVEFFSSLNLAENAVKYFTIFKDAIVNAFKGIPAFFSGLKEKFDEFKKKIADLGGIKFSNIGEIFAAFKETILSYFTSEGGELLAPIKDAFTKLWADIKAGFSKNNFLVSIYNKIVGIITKIKEAIDGFNPGSIIDKIKSFFSPKDSGIEGAEKADKKNWISIAIDAIVKGFDNLNKLAPGIKAMIGLIGALVGFKMITKIGGFAKKLVDAFTALPIAQAKELKSRALLEVAIAIGILVAALAALTALIKIDGLALLGALGIVAALMVALLAVSRVLSSKAIDAKAVGKSAMSFILIAGAIAILAITMKILETLDPNKAGRSVGGLILLMALMVGLTYAMSAVQKKAGGAVKGGASIFALVASMFLLLVLLKVLEHYKIKHLGRVIGNMIILLAALAGLCFATRALGKKAKGAWKTILALAGALLIMSVAMKILSTIPWEGMKKAVVGLIAMGVVLGVLMAVSKLAEKSAKSILMIGIVLAILTVCLAALSIIPTDRLLNASLALGGVLLALAAAFAIMGVVSKLAGKSVLVGALMMAVILAAVTAALYILTTIEPGALLPAAQSLAIVLLALSAAMAVLTLVGTFAAGALAGMGLLVLFIAGFAAMAVAMGALVDKFPALQTFLDSGIEILVQIANGIGRMVGAFLAGFSEELANSLPAVAESLKVFLEKMQEAASVGTFDFMPLAEAIGAIALIDFAGFFGSLGSIVNEIAEGKSNAQVFADDLIALSTAFASYQTTMDTVDGIEIDYTPLTEAFTAITAISLTGFFTSLGSLVSEFTEGKTNVQVFSDDLTSLATAFATYQTTMDSVDDIEIDTTGLTEVTDAMGSISLTGFFSAIGSIFSDDGKTAVETFSSDLTTLSESLVNWQTTMDGMDEITIDSEGIQKLVDAINSVPKQSLFDAIGNFFSKDTSFDDFKTNSGKLGEAITAFSDSLGDIDGDKMTVASTAAKMIGDLGVSLKSIDLKSGWFSGDTDFDRFGKAIVPFGTALNDFANAVADPEKVASVSEAALDVARAGAKMSEIDLSSGDIMDAEKVTQFKDHVDGIIDAVSKASDAGTQNTSGADRLKSAVEKLKSIKLGSEDTSSAGDAGKETGDAVASGISESSTKLGDALSGALSAAAGAVASTVSGFSSIGANAVNALANGITKGASKVKDRAKRVMTGAINAINNKKYKETVQNAGYNFSAGFAKGVLSGTARARIEADAMAAAALQAAKKRLQEKSPSKATRKIGEFFGMGFVNGINSQREDAYRSGASIADQARGGLEKATDLLKRVLTNNMDMSPTIRPVLDLSEIQNGAGMIGSMLDTRPSIALAGNIDAINATVDSRRMVTTGDILDALGSLKDNLNRPSGDTYNINGVTYDDGSNISSAVQTLVRAARVERRV